MKTNFSRSIVMEAMEQRVLFSADASVLTETVVSDTLPTSISNHITATGKISVNVANNSGVKQSGAIFVDVVSTTDFSLDLQSQDTFLLAAKRESINLQNGESKTFIIPVTVKKEKFEDGTFPIYAVAADREDGLSQSASSGGSFTVHPPIITLSETESFVKLPPAVVSAGKFNVTDKVVVTNSGTDPSTDKLTVNIIATPDGIAADGVVIKSFTPRPGIRPGKLAKLSFHLSKLPVITDGVYDLITQVTLNTGVSTTTDPTSAPTITVGEGDVTTR